MLTDSFKSQYPPQTGLYAVKVKDGDDWKKHDTCRLHISVGQPYHEGSKFQSTMAWALVRFQTVIVCVNDVLQMTNMVFERGLSRPQAYDQSIQDGDDWIERNKDVLDGAHVMRWEQWKTWPDYARAFQAVLKTYQNDDAFRCGIGQTAQGFWRKRCGQHPAYRPERRDEFMSMSEEYLLEEVAVICRMIEQKRAIDIYPGTMLPVFDVMKGRDLPFAPSALSARDFARIDFSRR